MVLGVPLVDRPTTAASPIPSSGLAWVTASVTSPLGVFDTGDTRQGPVSFGQKFDVPTRWALIPLFVAWSLSVVLILAAARFLFHAEVCTTGGFTGDACKPPSNLERLGGVLRSSGSDRLVLVVWTLSAFLMWVPSVERWYARHVFRVRRPLERETVVLEPAFLDVLEAAGIRHHSFELWVEDTTEDNAFAALRSIVCVTRGALERETPEQLRGTIAHELGHHLGWHTRVSSLQCWYLLPVEFLCRVPLLKYLFQPVYAAIVSLSAIPGQRQEYRADQTAVALGYGEGLIDYFYGVLSSGAVDHRRFDSLMRRATASHPSIPNRIARMEAAIAAGAAAAPPPGIGSPAPPPGMF